MTRPSRSGAPRRSELAGRETWLVSALHGIRAVTRWVGGRRAGAATRAATWQRLLDESAGITNQRRLIANERYRSPSERQLRVDWLRTPIYRNTIPPGRKVGEPSEPL